MRLANAEERETFRNVWVVAELLGGHIQPVTHELIGAARALADARHSEVWTVVLGPDVAGQTDALFASGCDVALVVESPVFNTFVDETESRVLLRLVEKYRPESVLCGATSRGRALIPRVAVMANAGLTADCTGLEIDPATGNLLQTRPAFGGNLMATIFCANHRPQMSTVRPRVMHIPTPDLRRKGRVIREPMPFGETDVCKRVIEVFHSTEAAVNLADARFIIAGGRGVKGKEGFDLLRKLATCVGGAVGASRATVDAGWIPYAHQVGQTGQTVHSTVYMACGISGQIQHLVGMQSCDHIIAIDQNPNTPMMQLADIAIEGDLFEIIPEFIRQIPAT